MNICEVNEMKKELAEFVQEFRLLIGRSERIHCCKQYLCGLMLDGERKSIQPIAERLPGGNEQNIQQFVNQSPWEHGPVLEKLSEKMQKELGDEKGVLILDDTSLPKKGIYSVGVARQYCGALGKISNCQVIVTWHYVGKKGHWPVRGELYLPKEWTDNIKRMKVAGVPQRRHKHIKKWQLAIILLRKIKNRIPYECTIFDAGYGELRPFLRELDNMREKFIGRIPATHSFWPVDVKLNKKKKNRGRPRIYPEVYNRSSRPLNARQWVGEIEKKEKWQTIELPLQKRKTVKALCIRVLEVNQKAYWRPGVERWLIIERDGDEQKYYVSSFPKNTSLKKMIYLLHQRWTIEQGYQQLKEELGLDHFEGRSWRGLHHHLTLTFMAYCFLQLMRKSLKKKLRNVPCHKSEDGCRNILQQHDVRSATPGLANSTGYFLIQANVT